MRMWLYRIIDDDPGSARAKLKHRKSRNAGRDLDRWGVPRVSRWSGAPGTEGAACDRLSARASQSRSLADGRLPPTSLRRRTGFLRAPPCKVPKGNSSFDVSRGQDAPRRAWREPPPRRQPCRRPASVQKALAKARAMPRNSGVQPTPRRVRARARHRPLFAGRFAISLKL